MPSEGALFGRERELTAALAVLDDAGPRGVVLSGDPGIGKTALWREVVDEARRRGRTALIAAPSGAEVRLTFAALGDLLRPVPDEPVDRLPERQRRALEIALMRADGPVDPHEIGAALLGLLRELAGPAPLLIAIDDMQWLDLPSAAALAFAVRRLESAPVAILATRRGTEAERRSPLDLESVLGRERLVEVTVGPLTLAAIHEVLVSRLGVELPRPTLVALFGAAGGNPFMALELAAELVRRGIEVRPGAPLPLPASIRELAAARVERLPEEVRELLLAAGALARPTVEVLARLRPDAYASLQGAAGAGVIEIDRDTISFTHPMLARVPYEALTPAERRELHARLAEVVDDPEERARHRALSATRSSHAIASEVARAAAVAGSRGASASAAELWRLAARLTPAANGDERSTRLLEAAEWCHRAGELAEAATLAHSVLAESESGAESEAESEAEPSADVRARTLSLLAVIAADTDGVEAALTLYARARREPGASAAVRAEVHRRVAWLSLGAGSPRRADWHARASLRLAAGRSEPTEAGAAAVTALAEVVRGRVLDRGLLARARALEDALQERGAAYWSETSPSVVEGVALLWAGELEEARAPLERIGAMAGERAEPWLEMHALAYLSALATAAGDPRHGLELGRRYLELAAATEQGPQRAGALWPVAVAAAWLGEEADARAAATEGAALARASGHTLYEIGCLGALALLELSLGADRDAVIAVDRGLALARSSGIEALARVPLHPDAVEALVACGELDRAAELAAELRNRAGVLGAPWALALAARCDGLLAEAGGDHDRAVEAFEVALAYHARQDRPAERARTQLALGRSLRREQRKRLAREALIESGRVFESIGAAVWAGRARRELARIGGRGGSATGELSATEASIASLVRQGRTNREVAELLHLSPRTVEWNLSKIYRKLGVRSRTELAAADEAGKSGGFTG